MSTELAPTWSGLVDDAAIFPPGDAPLPVATAAHLSRGADDGAALVGTFVLRDTDLPQVAASTHRSRSSSPAAPGRSRDPPPCAPAPACA